MRMPATRRALFALAASSTVAARAVAQDYPSRPVRIVVPVAPGGSTDTIGRVLAEELNRRNLGQFFVENRPGAGSNLAYAHVAQQPPDGHTLLVAVDSLTVNPTLYSRVEYDPVGSFAPVSLMARIPHILVTHRGSPAQTFAEFMHIAETQPDRLNVAISGIGSGGHLSGAVIQHQTRARWTVIPYRGGATPLNDLVAGNVDAAFVTLGAVIGLLRDRRVVPLAITTPTRFPLLPDVPTVAELALPGYDVPNWYGVLAPAGTPAPIVTRLNTMINEALAEPRVRATLLDNGFELVGGPPEVLGTLVRESVPRWAALIRAAGMRAE
jgi:tripartite-type tricarboxylate transporter receptor subunit TctC